MSSRTEYRRTLSASRTIGEAFRAATKTYRGCEGLAERLFQLDLDDLPEDERKHHTSYVGAILEFATQHTRATDGSGNPDDQKEVDRRDPRAFAMHFLNKRPEYSRNANGVAAVQMESWIIQSSGHLFERFVETVLESGDRFLTIFEGKLNSEEVRKMRFGVSEFTSLKPLIEAGEFNGEETFEFTIFDCKATGTKPTAEPELRTTEPPIGDKRRDGVKLPGVRNSMESLLPSSREEYDAVYEQGGLSRTALEVVAGDDIFETLVEVEGGQRVQDPNGVTWTSEDGATWTPDVDSLDEAYDEYDKPSQVPRNYRKVTPEDPGSCANCRFFRNGDYCTLYSYPVGADWMCDLWAARDAGLREDAPDESDELDTDEQDAAVRSDYGAWGVVQEGGQTVVVVRESAWLVPHPFDEVVEGISALGEMYGKLPAERDLMVEAYLVDYAGECGAPCAVPEAVEDMESSVEERDLLIDENNAARLEEDPPEDDRNALLERAGELVDEDYPDVEQGGEQWHQLRMGVFGSLSRELAERQKTTPTLAFDREEKPSRAGAFKVSGKALRLWKAEVPGFELKDTMFKRVREVVAAIPRTDLPKLFGVNADDASAIPDAQDVVAGQPRRAFQMFLRKVKRVHPKIHGYLQKVPSNASIIFHMVVSRLSGEDMANQIFRRFFSTESDHPAAAMAEAKHKDGDDEGGDAKKP